MVVGEEWSVGAANGRSLVSDETVMPRVCSMLNHGTAQGPPDTGYDGLDVAQPALCALLKRPHTADEGRALPCAQTTRTLRSGPTIYQTGPSGNTRLNALWAVS